MFKFITDCFREAKPQVEYIIEKRITPISNTRGYQVTKHIKNPPIYCSPPPLLIGFFDTLEEAQDAVDWLKDAP